VNTRVALVERLHASPNSGVIAVTGGGTLLLADLLTVPGASATVLEARVPYASRALGDFIGAVPEQACSLETACNMAMAGFQTARTLAADEPAHRFGLGCTASLATQTAKRGEHRAHLALQTLNETRTWSIVFTKGARDRLGEERLLADIALDAFAETFALAPRVSLDLRAGEEIDGERAVAPAAWGEVLLGRVRAVPIHRADPPSVLFPGAFNPLHEGHLAMAQHAAQVFGVPVAFEICTNNVDKPQLNYLALRHRISQFDAATPVWITNTPTFVEKARCFPGARFVVGVDTMHRIGQVQYYGNDAARLSMAVGEIGDLGCRFLVFGRSADGRFIGLDDLALPDALRALCIAVPEADFRRDVSSSALRRQRVRAALTLGQSKGSEPL
jgi:cytidyltransferase-like protein